MSGKIVLYGANGFTGQIAIEQLLKPRYQDLAARGVVLAGRNRSKLEPLLPQGDVGRHFEIRVFSLEDPNEVDKGIEDAAIVLHMAGMFDCLIC